MKNVRGATIVAASVLSLLAGPLSVSAKNVSLKRATPPPAEELLLDVHIVVFEPAEDFLPQVRRAEARYVPVALKRVFETSGFWGSVRVVPDAGHAELVVTGAVRTSHGGRFEIEVRAVDATGKVWLDKKYKDEPDASVYLNRESTLDPFQSVYHRIANDASKKYKKLKPKDIARIRDVARLRFASDLAPDAFADYITVKKSRYRIARLPSRDDPMAERIALIRQRDRMFIDTVDAFYARLFEKMDTPYRGWRSQDYWQREAMKNGPPTAQRSGGGNAPWGVLIADPGRSGSGQGLLCGTPGVMGRGTDAEDERRWQEELRKSHLDILRELGESLAAHVEPLVVEIDGNVAELTGSVEEQYAKWRALMREIFTMETGLPADTSSDN